MWKGTTTELVLRVFAPLRSNMFLALTGYPFSLHRSDMSCTICCVTMALLAER